jgi:hypothetical protein
MDPAGFPGALDHRRTGCNLRFREISLEKAGLLKVSNPKRAINENHVLLSVAAPLAAAEKGLGCKLTQRIDLLPRELPAVANFLELLSGYLRDCSHLTAI